VSDVVLTQRDGAVLTITLNRPAAMNALTRELHAELHEALLTAGHDEGVRCVVITGAGRAFCAGQDLTELAAIGGSVGDALEETYHPNLRLVRELAKPVLAALNGAAAGAGLSFALGCDVRIASDAAVLVPGFVGIGLVPDAGGSWALERLLGPARAFDWMSSNRRLSADEALAWGLVSEVVPEDAFAERTAELAAEWAARPTGAVAGLKRLLDAAHGRALDAQLADEAAEQQRRVESADFAEGVAAFLAKRAPRFSGS
jgi:2-(1,2-epoxy-1,2-dihydrophenyl)acetyl-CoA isomerase